MRNKKRGSPWDYLLGTDDYQWIKLPYNIWPILKKINISGWDIPILVSILIKKRAGSSKIHLPFEYIQTTTGCNRNAIYASLAKFKQFGLEKLKTKEDSYDVDVFFDYLRSEMSRKTTQIKNEDEVPSVKNTDMMEENHVK